MTGSYAWVMLNFGVLLIGLAILILVAIENNRIQRDTLDFIKTRTERESVILRDYWDLCHNVDARLRVLERYTAPWRTEPMIYTTSSNDGRPRSFTRASTSTDLTKEGR